MRKTSILALVLIVSSCQCEDDVTPWAFEEPADVGGVADVAVDIGADAENPGDASFADVSDAADVSGPADASTPDARDMPTGGESFAGLWKVDQPAHALYEATLYDFVETGELVEVESVDLGAGLVPTGRVAECLDYAPEDEGGWCTSWGVECVFEKRWREDPAASAIEVECACTDGVKRWVRLAFPDGFDGGYLMPSVSVEGDDAWEHNSFEWAWTRCVADPCIEGF